MKIQQLNITKGPEKKNTSLHMKEIKIVLNTV